VRAAERTITAVDAAPFLERRRQAVAAAWGLASGVVLIAAGREIPVPGRGDRTYPFRAHSEYLYLADRERPGGVLAFDPDAGWIEFVEPVTARELLWSGLEGDREGVPEGTRPVEELEEWLADRPVRHLGATLEPDVELRDALIRVRRPKDELELMRMRAAERATRAGLRSVSN
jgi:Xaa-Pro aminopeptidase